MRFSPPAMAKGKEQDISYEEFQSSLRKRDFAPLYLFYGEEEFLIKESFDLLIREALGESGRNFNLDIVYGADVGSSLYEIQNEIDKLLIYIGEKKMINIEDVGAVVGMSREFNIFELQKVVGQKNMTRSVEILERMLNAGESPLGLIVMLSRY